jgi:hypothetical protein
LVPHVHTGEGAGRGGTSKTDHILGKTGSRGMRTRSIYKHGVHNSFVIYKYTAVLQLFKFHKKWRRGGEREERKTNEPNKKKKKRKKKTLKKK